MIFNLINFEQLKRYMQLFGFVFFFSLAAIFSKGRQLLEQISDELTSSFGSNVVSFCDTREELLKLFQYTQQNVHHMTTVNISDPFLILCLNVIQFNRFFPGTSGTMDYQEVVNITTASFRSPCLI